jgi:hypothetical protein
MITEIDEKKPPLLILHPESAQERDGLLTALHYPVPLNPEDMRDVGLLSLADYELKPDGGRAGFGSVALEFQRSKETRRGVIDPDRQLRPMKVPSGDLLSAHDLLGTWHFTASPGSKAQPFQMTLQNVSAGTVETEMFGLISGRWMFARPGSRETGFTGSADGRTGVFTFVLSRGDFDVRIVGSFIARGQAIATYIARTVGQSMTGQIEGTKAS